MKNKILIVIWVVFLIFASHEVTKLMIRPRSYEYKYEPRCDFANIVFDENHKTIHTYGFLSSSKKEDSKFYTSIRIYFMDKDQKYKLLYEKREDWLVLKNVTKYPVETKNISIQSGYSYRIDFNIYNKISNEPICSIVRSYDLRENRS